VTHQNNPGAPSLVPLFSLLHQFRVFALRYIPVVDNDHGPALERLGYRRGTIEEVGRRTEAGHRLRVAGLGSVLVNRSRDFAGRALPGRWSESEKYDKYMRKRPPAVFSRVEPICYFDIADDGTGHLVVIEESESLAGTDRYMLDRGLLHLPCWPAHTWSDDPYFERFYYYSLVFRPVGGSGP